MSENELDARVEQLYRRVSAEIQHDRITTVWVRFDVNAESDAAAMAVVREQVLTGRDRGATAREVQTEPPRWDAAPMIPLDQSEVAGEAGH